MEARRSKPLTVALEVGGAFTDLVAYDEDHEELTSAKVASTRPDFVGGVLAALGQAEIDPAEVRLLKYGSTIATDVVIERSGARTGLITTKGFKDLLGMACADPGRGLAPRAPVAAALVRRQNVLTVEERIDHEGTVQTPLNEDEVHKAALRFAKRGIEAIAVCYLNSFVNPAHELRTKEILGLELGTSVTVSASTEVLPEIGELARTCTTVANAYLMPSVARHLGQLRAALESWGYCGEVLVAHARGGLVPAAVAMRMPAWTCRSGSACSTVGAARAGERAGFPDAITFDVGARRAAVALVHDGLPEILSHWHVERGVPVHLPGVSQVSIGTGGGTIAWVDAGGALRIGPPSGGSCSRPADSGPGDPQPTLNDAHLHLGRLDPTAYLDGSLDPLHSESALAALGDKVGMSPTGTAGCILRIADAGLAAAARAVTTRKGRDPRALALIAGGGTGPLHAVVVAQGLGMGTVVVPPAAGVAAAFGVLSGGLHEERRRSLLVVPNEVEPDALTAVFRELEWEARTAAEHMPAQVELSLDVRYRGQAGFLTLPLEEAPANRQAIDLILDRFAESHERLFGFRHHGGAAEVELVAASVAVVGPPSRAWRAPSPKGASRPRPRQVRQVYFDESEGFVDTPVYDRPAFEPGAYLDGPALVEQHGTTALVPPGATLEVDPHLNLLIDVRQEPTSRRREGASVVA
jgi:N-methylhydantoinase A